MGLNDVVNANNYPIIFIGSGISKRYLAHSPSWIELLEEFWKIVSDDDFYKHLAKIRNDIQNSHDEGDIQFLVNTSIATEIQKKYDSLYFSQELSIEGLDSKYLYENNISPFKYSIAKRFSKYELRDDINEKEFDEFKKLLVNARIIITTNYDTFLEDILKDVEHKPKIFVGQDGFFSDTSGWGELFKIHGSISAPSSIILNTEDYKIYDKNSILISAKIIATMIYSPILFLGYSLTDRNIKKLLADFSSQIPSDDARNTSDRIIVVEYEQKNNTLAESITTDSSRQLSYTHISTNNYIELYKKINSINEGLTPYEIMKYTDAIKQLVVTSGAAGSLESVLLSPTDLDNVVDDIDKGKPIVVAMGDNKYIFVNPTTTSYLSDYILEKFEILPENALRFIAREQQAGRYPFLKHYMDCNLDASHLEEFEKKNLASRYTKDFTNLNSITDTINKRNRIECKSIQNILELSDTKLANKIDLITYNSAKLNYNELDNYVKNTALPEFNKMYKLRTTKNSAEKSAYRKLFVAWDILTFGKK